LQFLECGDLSPLSLRGGLTPRLSLESSSPKAATGCSLEKR
jgi:hypothetical protein